MNYEIVTLTEKTIVGFSARTNNSSAEMSATIGGLWQKLYSESSLMAITNRTNNKAVGVYTDYAADEAGDYTAMAAFEVADSQNIPNDMTVHKIPSGQYAKFVVKGNMVTAVSDFWQELWKMNLKRTFICDFEEYQNADFENAQIHIYIGIR